MTSMRPTELEALAAMDIYPQPAREAVLKLIARHKRLVEACKAALDFMVEWDVHQRVVSGLSLQLYAALKAEEQP